MNVIVTGGMLRESTSSMVGPLATDSIAEMGFDRAFLGASGFTIEHGYCNSNLYEAEVKKLVIKQANVTYMVLDHTKLGTKVIFSFAENGDVPYLLTDREPESKMREGITRAGTQVLIAP